MTAPTNALRGLASLRLASLYVADVALAGGVAGLSVLVDAFGPDVRADGVLVWDLALAAPLVLRRRSPTSCAAAVAAVCLIQWLSDVRAAGDLALLVALYTIGSREPRRPVLITSVLVAELGVVMVVLRWQTGHSDAVAVLLLTGPVTAAWVLGLYVRTRRSYLASVIERALTAERERDSGHRIAVADERVRIAREMHDVVAHGLSVMISLNDGAAALASTPEVREAVSQAADVGRQALEEMRFVLGVLRSQEQPQLVPQPGIAQLPDLVGTARAAGLSVQLAATGEVAAIPPSAQLTVYRIVQESLTNVLKHAHNVSRVSVDVVYQHPLLSVVVTNDGAVVRPSATPPAGHGLTGIRERAELYGGQVHATPAAGGGWTVRAELTLPEPLSRP